MHYYKHGQVRQHPLPLSWRNLVLPVFVVVVLLAHLGAATNAAGKGIRTVFQQVLFTPLCRHILLCLMKSLYCPANSENVKDANEFKYLPWVKAGSCTLRSSTALTQIIFDFPIRGSLLVCLSVSWQFAFADCRSTLLPVDIRGRARPNMFS